MLPVTTVYFYADIQDHVISSTIKSPTSVNKVELMDLMQEPFV